MLLKTDETKARTAPFDAREKYRAQVREWVARETANCGYLDDPETSPANVARRMGRPMLASELELRLGKLNSRLMFEHNPYNNTKKALYHVDQRGKEFVCAYEAGMMPERSVFRVKVDYVPEDVEHIDRKDLGPQELIPGRGFVPKDGKNPYMKRVLIPWGEQMRGWRTVLIRLVAMGLLTPTQVETTFGADNTPEWQGQMGKTPLQRPW